jgi:hypothetical protein
MRVLICGDRLWDDKELIRATVQALLKKHKKLVVIDGTAPGADRLGHEVAKELKLGFQRFPADWMRYGLAAGPIRNRQMLKEGRPDLVLAFHDDLKMSKGTKDMIKVAQKAGVEVIKVKH